MDFEQINNVMPKRIYFLELLRSIAAIYVFVYHVLQRLHNDTMFSKIFFSFGQEAVILFFVLSGFVIYYSQKLKTNKLKPDIYILARFLRIYPVFLFALLISYLSVCVNMGSFVSFDFPLLIENICMLQDFSVGKPGVWVDAYMGNGPLWSLSYEWWFYVLFIPIFFMKPVFQIHVVFAVSIISLFFYFIFPNQICLWLTYFSIWWSGVEAAKYYLKVTTNKPFVIFIYLSILLAILVAYTLFIFKGNLDFGIFPVLFIRHFSMALMFYTFLIVFNVTKIPVNEKNLLVRFAPFSYGFYILHYPILNIFNHKGWLQESLFSIVPMIVIILVIVWIAEKIVHVYLSRLLKIYINK